MSIDTHDVLRTLRRGALVGLVILIGAPLAAIYLTSRQQPVYRTAANVVVAPDPGLAEATEILRALESLERRSILATFAEMAKSPAVRRAAAERLETDLDGLLGYRVTASVLPHANVLRIGAEGPDAARTALLAQAVADVVGEEAHRLYSPFSVRPLSEAEAPRAPTSPDRRRNLIVALVIGAFAGLVAAYGFGRLVPVAGRMEALRPKRAHAVAE